MVLFYFLLLFYGIAILLYGRAILSLLFICPVIDLYQCGLPLVAQMVKNLFPVQIPGLIPGLGRSPGGGLGNPLQYSCLENSVASEAWQATTHKVAKSWT